MERRTVRLIPACCAMADPTTVSTIEHAIAEALFIGFSLAGLALYTASSRGEGPVHSPVYFRGGLRRGVAGSSRISITEVRTRCRMDYGLVMLLFAPPTSVTVNDSQAASLAGFLFWREYLVAVFAIVTAARGRCEA